MPTPPRKPTGPGRIRSNRSRRAPYALLAGICPQPGPPIRQEAANGEPGPDAAGPAPAEDEYTTSDPGTGGPLAARTPPTSTTFASVTPGNWSANG